MEVSGRKRNSQDDTLPRSKINTETDTPEQKAWNVQPHWLAKCSDSLRSRDGVLDRCLRWSVHVTTGRVLSPAIIISQILQIDLIYLTLGQIHATCNNNVTQATHYLKRESQPTLVSRPGVICASVVPTFRISLFIFVIDSLALCLSHKLPLTFSFQTSRSDDYTTVGQMSILNYISVCSSISSWIEQCDFTIFRSYLPPQVKGNCITSSIGVE